MIKQDDLVERLTDATDQSVNAELLAALEAAQRLCREALPKFDWCKSALDANAITLLNEVPIQIDAALVNALASRFSTYQAEAIDPEGGCAALAETVSKGDGV
jgi:hypothetical protein